MANGKLRVKGVTTGGNDGTPKLTLRTIAQPGEALDGRIGTTSGYIKVTYWDNTTQILGDGTPFDYDTWNGAIIFTREIGIEEPYVNGIIQIISCDIDGNANGDIISIETSLNNLQKYDLINVSTLTQLKYLYCQSILITSVNISGLNELVELVVDDTQVTSIDVSNLPNLKVLRLTASAFNNITLSNLPSLESLYSTGYGFNSLDLSGFTNLSLVDLNNCFNLSSLNIDGCVHLASLYIGYTALDSTNIDSLIISANNNGNSFGTIVSDGSKTRTEASADAYNNLVTNKNWYIPIELV